MEADWEVQIGGDSPIIDACWAGFIDLRSSPEMDPGEQTEGLLRTARELAETVDLPRLAEALIRLNASHSPVWTSKCDVWTVEAADLDPDELDSPADEATQAWACYIDLLPLNGVWPSCPEVCSPSISPEFPGLPATLSTEAAVHCCKTWCEQLRAIPLTHCRADLIVRQACIAPEVWSHGITAYLTACGPSSGSANAALARTLAAFAQTISPDSPVE
jgi:hypothetical protein